MVQPRQLNLPTQRDPLARLALVALVAAACWLALGTASAPVAAETVLIATPTIGILPTQPPTEAPVVAQAVPTITDVPAPASTAEPVIVEVEVPVIVEVTAVSTALPAPTALPAGSIIILPTATQTNEDFVASFGAPTADATCQFTGCLHQP